MTTTKDQRRGETIARLVAENDTLKAERDEAVALLQELTKRVDELPKRPAAVDNLCDRVDAFLGRLK